MMPRNRCWKSMIERPNTKGLSRGTQSFAEVTQSCAEFLIPCAPSETLALLASHKKSDSIVLGHVTL